MDDDLTTRQQEALAAFVGRDALRLCDMPTRIGIRTMDQLVYKGWVTPVDNRIGRYSKHYKWKLVRRINASHQSL